MKLASSLVFVLAITAAVACSKDKPSPSATTTNNADTAAASVASAEPSAVPGGHHGHRSCPSRVHGATATASDVDGGVMISVIGGDDATVAEIQSRATALGAMAPDPNGRRGRFCPELEEGTTRTITATTKGAQITLVPTNAVDLTRIRSDVRDHLAHAEKRPD